MLSALEGGALPLVNTGTGTDSWVGPEQLRPAGPVQATENNLWDVKRRARLNTPARPFVETITQISTELTKSRAQKKKRLTQALSS